MKITLKNDNGTYTVSSNREFMHITVYFSELIIPVLQAAGFSSKTIKEGLDKDYGLKE
jgi:hypothetical protein